MTDYKVLITTSGLGQRLGDITNYTNKSLVRVGKKPVISYIIESYPENIELVVTVGHFADQIKDFIKLVYPKRKVTFVQIDKYQGGGSSLGYSMLQAKKHLQCPFVFHAGDTIVKKKIPSPKSNWSGGFRNTASAQYRSFKVVGDKVIFINEKNASDFDYLHIGLVGIRDYRSFWKELECLYQKDPSNSSLGDCAVINSMIKKGKKFLAKEFKSWLDTGNIEGLNRAKKDINNHFQTLDKVKESIFIFDDSVVKFFFDPKKVKQRVKRGRLLKGLVPKIEGYQGNFYRYKFAKGDLYSRVATPSDFKKFLIWSKKNLWQKKKEIVEKDFKKACFDFYYKKSKRRIKQFLELNSLQDEKNIINGEEVPSIEKILKKIDFNYLSRGEQYQFHGDFILDNILKTKNSYCLLDWRQNFANLLEVGDIYYDFAKLNHNLTVNHDVINDNMFSVKINGKSVFCDIFRKDNLVSCQEIFYQFLKEAGFDLNKVELLTPLIWLNMSPLHHYPFNLFLFYFGKLKLWRRIKKQ